MKKLWSSDDDDDDEEGEVEECPTKDYDPPKYADHVNYITCFILLEFALFTSYFGSFVAKQVAFCSIFMLVK